MEARASFSGASVPKAFVAAVLVIVAMGLAAMGGYVARGLSSGGAVQATVHAAPGTVLRQDNPARSGAELPAYIQQGITPKANSRFLQDDPYFIAQQSGTNKAASDSGLATRKGGHQELP